MDINEIKKIWDDVKLELEFTVPFAYEAWIVPLVPVGFDNGVFSVYTGQALAVQIIRKNHLQQVKDALKNVIGEDVEFDIIFDEELALKLSKKSTRRKVQATEKTQMELAIDNLAQMQSASNLNLKYKFDNFVVGENNKFAHATAMAVAQHPAKRYNPLFIYGGSGLGKTHLMQAIGHYILFNKSKLKVRYTKTEDYMNELINNLKPGGDTNKRMENFRQKFRNVDVLLLDDIQFVESKTRTMDEIFHTFDSLHNSSKQIVITSDRLPKDIPTLPERLRTRFEMGLMVDLTPPDFETRVAILLNLANEIGMEVKFDVFEFIANNFSSNIRELEGAFNKVSAYASISQVDLTLDIVKQVLKSQLVPKEISIDKILDVVCAKFGVTKEELKSNSRGHRISSSRHIAVYLIRELMGLSFVKIAEYFNKKHPTILFSYEKIKEEVKSKSEVSSVVSELRNKLK